MKKVVLVTGGSRGIGAATVEAFAKANYNIVINYLKEEKKANELKNNIEQKYSVSVLTLKADVSNKEDVKKMIHSIVERFKRIDVLVNNAGIAIDQILEDKTEVEFRKVIDVNLIGLFIVTKEVGKIMQEQGNGKIINVTSTNAIDTYYPESMDYDASKAGVISLTKNFATLFSPSIQVNAVAVGWTKTDMLKDMDLELIKNEEQKILLGRFAEPSEIASVIYFLATEEASYINGSIIRVDGGKKV